jgi:hypothetical protein
MNKIAQRRGFIDKFRETVNMPGKYLDGIFRPEIERVMASLKEMDDRIRAVFTGKTIGNAMPTDGVAVKDVLKSARRNFNRREYMSAVIDLGAFHKKMLAVSKDISEFKVDVDKIHHKFLFEGLKGTDYESKLDPFRQHMKDLQTKAEDSTDGFVKEAGMLDDLLTFLSRRGRGLMAWEKRYPQKIKALRDGADALINESQKVFESSLANLKGMATARATRRPDEYIEIANKMKADFDKFDGNFRGFYAKAVQPWLDVKDQIEAKEKAQAEADGTGAPTGTQAPGQTPPVPDLDIKTPPQNSAVQPTPGPSAGPPSGVPSGVMSSPPSAPKLELPLQPEEEAPDTVRSPPPVHAAFYASLEKLGNESPRVLAKYIARYAVSIQTSDPKTAVELFNVVRKIKG